MSTAQLPSSDMGAGNTSAVWRIAHGKLLQGREADGTLIERETLTMRLLRVGVHEGKGEDGEPYRYFEAEGETSDLGKVIVHVNTNSVVSSTGFARAMLDTHPGMDIMFHPRRAGKANKYGTFVTYCNVSAVAPNGVRGARLGGDYDPSDTVDSLAEAMKSLPHYKERVKPEEGYDPSLEPETCLDVWAREVEKAGKADLYLWPYDHPETWLELASYMDDESYTKIEDVPGETVAAIAARIRQDGPAPEMVATPKKKARRAI